MTYFCFNSDIPANLIVHTNTTLEAGSTFIATCLVMTGILNFTEIDWINNNRVAISYDILYTAGSQGLSVDLTLSQLNTSNAGTYTCETRIEEYNTLLISTKEVNVTVKGDHVTITLVNVSLFIFCSSSTYNIYVYFIVLPLFCGLQCNTDLLYQAPSCSRYWSHCDCYLDTIWCDFSNRYTTINRL